MYELLLTRIFSVTVYYHFAFMALSIAMFGTSIGGILVFVFADWFGKRNFSAVCALSALGFSATALSAVLLHINIPMMADGQMLPGNILLTWAAIALPFLFGGIILSLVFTRFNAQISGLYAADLLGAGLGCLGLLWTLRIIDGLSAVLLVCALAAISGLFFAVCSNSKKLLIGNSLAALLLFTALLVNATQYNQGHPLMHIVWAKGTKVDGLLYERWNSFSWIAVSGNPKADMTFACSGISSTYHPKQPIHGLNLDIDGSARTSLVGWESNLNKFDAFKADLTNIAHYLRPHADVLVIGAGGGKDLVSALVFDQKHVTGVEINENTLNADNKVFGDFTGHLDQNPKVSFVNDEARSYLARHEQRYDIIQMPFIDTWAATANGAYVLTENSLYTVEAWRVFLSRLNNGGIFTVTRWYDGHGRGEILRMVSLAAEALKQGGISDPRSHIILLRNRNSPNPETPGVGTILVSPQPFSADDVKRIAELAKHFKFELILSPDSAEDALIAKLASGHDLAAVAAGLPINILPPFDDSPFFFNMLRPTDLFNPKLAEYSYDPNVQAVMILAELLLLSVSATLLCLVLPMRFARASTGKSVSISLVSFFLLVGFAFMFIEIALIQRLIVFLGHPVYGISAVACTLLISSGIGSYVSKPFQAAMNKRGWICLLPIVAALIIVGACEPVLIAAFRQSEILVRLGVAISMVSVLGLFMGMAFPIGLTVASRDNARLAPWYWSINGAGSVTGSVLAVLISLSWGITALYWCAIAGYIACVFALSQAERAPAGG